MASFKGSRGTWIELSEVSGREKGRQTEMYTMQSREVDEETEMKDKARGDRKRDRK